MDDMAVFEDLAGRSHSADPAGIYGWQQLEPVARDEVKGLTPAK
jgi:hypothetical protein